VLRGAGMHTAGAGRDLEEAEAPAVVPLPAASATADRSTSSSQRLLVWAVGHSSSGVPAAWAAAQGRPGIFAADLSQAGVMHLAELVSAHKQPGDIARVSGEAWQNPWLHEAAC
jgi:poly-gamma-glutamate synthesis protein (capsule biosynthesis protein)